MSSQGSFVLAPYNAEYFHTELNDFTDPEPFLYNNGDGFPGGLNLLNVGQGAETITFTISIGAPTIEVDQEFIDFARKVYITNDKRFEVKNEINLLFNTSLREIKDYQEY